MGSTRRICSVFLAAAVALSPVAVAQKVVRKAPTTADWAALAKLPDFTGVWEMGFGGGGGRGRGAGRADAGLPLERVGRPGRMDVLPLPLAAAAGVRADQAGAAVQAGQVLL